MKPRLPVSYFRWLHALGCPTVLAFALWIPSGTRANDTNYQNFVIGSRAIGFGGAFCAISDDPSGLYYNPSGIAEVDHNSLQISASLYGYERGSVGGATSSPIPGVGEKKVKLDAAFTDLVVVPAAVGSAHAFGAKGPDGKPLQSWAFTILVPSYHTSNLDEETSSDGRDTTYSRQLTDRAMWAGTGYGRRLTRVLSLGISAFYKLRVIESTEETSVTEPEEVDGEKAFRVGSSKVKMYNGSLLVIVGAKYRLSDRLTVGLSVTPPSIAINSGGTFKYNRGISDPSLPTGNRSEYLRTKVNDISGESRINFQSKMGAAYVVPSMLTAALDISLFAPVHYPLVNISDPKLKRALPIVPNVRRNFVANVNAGVEYLFYPGFTGSIGAFTDFSSAPSIKTDDHHQTSRNQLERVNIFGGTLALGFYSDHILSHYGITYAAGSGEAVLPLDNSQWLLGGESKFSKVEIFRSFFYLFASGAYLF